MILDLITLGIKPFIEKNTLYYNIVNDFREKLPRHQNRGKSMTKENLPNEFSNLSEYFLIIDTNTHKSNISEIDLDIFYNKINTFDYSFVIFKKYYKRYTSNLNRLKPTPINGDLDLIVLQEILFSDPKIHPLKFWDIFLFQSKMFLNKLSK